MQKQRKEMEGKRPGFPGVLIPVVPVSPQRLRTAVSEAQRGCAELARRWAFLQFTGRHWVLSGVKLYPLSPRSGLSQQAIQGN